MLKLALALALPAIVFPTLALRDSAESERAAVERAVQDYVEAFYEAKPELIERGVHKDLTKYGFWRNDEGEYQPFPMTYDQARALAERWNADGQQGENLEYEIELLDVSDKTAAAKLTAKWGIDYMHLAKFDGEWKTLHVLWQSAPLEVKKQ
jgi:hypothetical protein